MAAVLALGACGERGGPYDASRDAGADVKAALVRARADGKRVLIEAGGNRCSRCRAMESFFKDHAGLGLLRDKNFVLVRVNVEAGGPAPAALKAYPAPAAYPHLYVLDENGSLIQSQAPAEFESGGGYDLEKLEFFLKAFAKPKA